MEINNTEILTMLFDSFKDGVNAPTETINAYISNLSDIPAPILKAGVIKSINACKFFPKIAEVRENCKEFYADVTGQRIKNHAEAWSEVMEKIRSVGINRIPTWSTPEINLAVKAFGWLSLCVLEERDLNTARAQFRDIYKAICERANNKAENEQIFNKLTTKEKKQLQASKDFVKQISENIKKIGGKKD